MIIPITLMLLAGCSNLSPARGKLLDATRAGVAGLKTSITGRATLIEQYQTQTRARLDAAFDLDVKETAAAGKLNARWTTDARKVYALGVDALATQRRASQQATAADLANLQAIDDALTQLKSLDALDRRWLSVVKGEADAKN